MRLPPLEPAKCTVPVAMLVAPVLLNVDPTHPWRRIGDLFGEVRSGCGASNR